MAIYAVQYTYDDRPDVRDVERPAHRSYLGALEADGVLLASGPYAGPADGTMPDGALLMVRAESAQAVAEHLDADPFALAGVIQQRTVREWTPVFGPWT
ncbi:MAG: YCII-related protein [Actinotalea sp.]|nr:YCII-related protein [Actinotalea sp.]